LVARLWSRGIDRRSHSAEVGPDATGPYSVELSSGWPTLYGVRVTSDPDEHARNLERWMSEDLAMFGVTRLERVDGGQIVSGLHMAGHEQH
jgi:hypothetical protein